mmetsp:Transcript_68560/g.198962  ORF Transcript_68560/g.198962 Transcript_68560/m.198962 type:complete len:338 (+) Transcript_68560:153-1166(+)
MAMSAFRASASRPYSYPNALATKFASGPSSAAMPVTMLCMAWKFGESWNTHRSHTGAPASLTTKPLNSMKTVRNGVATNCATCASFANAATHAKRLSKTRNTDRVQGYKISHESAGNPTKKKTILILAQAPRTASGTSTSKFAKEIAHSLYSASDVSYFMYSRSSTRAGMKPKLEKQKLVTKMKKNGTCCTKASRPTFWKMLPSTRPMKAGTTICKARAKGFRTVIRNFRPSTAANCRCKGAARSLTWPPGRRLVMGRSPALCGRIASNNSATVFPADSAAPSASASTPGLWSAWKALIKAADASDDEPGVTKSMSTSAGFTWSEIEKPRDLKYGTA